MSYAAIEVELREGRVIALGAEPLPKSGEGVLVLRSDEKAKTDSETQQSWLPALAEIRSRQKARGHVPCTTENVQQRIDQERESWE